MKNPGISSHTAWKRLLSLALGALLGWWLYSSIRNGAEQDDLVAVDLSGKQHIGPDFNISEFFSMEPMVSMSDARAAAAAMSVAFFCRDCGSRAYLSICDGKWQIGSSQIRH
jgi:hypothetical protein